MSKKNPKYDDLPKLQRKIVFSLAREGIMTMSDTNKKIKGENTSTTRAFHELESKEMVTRIGTKEYRGREFSKYWLSFRGVAFALLNGANPETLRKCALAFSQTDEDKRAIEVYFDLHSLSSRTANVLDRFLLATGKLEPLQLFKQLLPEMVSMDTNEIRRLLDKARAYPEYWKYTLGTLTKFMDAIKKIRD
jgi:hypothetical protein